MITPAHTEFLIRRTEELRLLGYTTRGAIERALKELFE